MHLLHAECVPHILAVLFSLTVLQELALQAGLADCYDQGLIRWALLHWPLSQAGLVNVALEADIHRT